MTEERKRQLKAAKEKAQKNIPKELADLIIDDTRSREKRSATEILSEMRYGHKVT